MTISLDALSAAIRRVAKVRAVYSSTGGRMTYAMGARSLRGAHADAVRAANVVEGLGLRATVEETKTGAGKKLWVVRVSPPRANPFRATLVRDDRGGVRGYGVWDEGRNDYVRRGSGAPASSLAEHFGTGLARRLNEKERGERKRETVSPSRARAIVAAAQKGSIGPWVDSLDRHMTPGERRYVKGVWNRMGGGSSFTSALLAIANDRVPSRGRVRGNPMKRNPVVGKVTKHTYKGVKFETFMEESEASGLSYWRAWALGLGSLASVGGYGAHDFSRAAAVAKARALIDQMGNAAERQRAYVNDPRNKPAKNPRKPEALSALSHIPIVASTSSAFAPAGMTPYRLVQRTFLGHLNSLATFYAPNDGAARGAAVRSLFADADPVRIERLRVKGRLNPRKRNPLTLPIGYTGDDLPGHAIPWSREGHKRIRAAIARIDRAKTHAEMFRAYHDAMKVTRSLDAKGLGPGRGYPHEWRNDIGSSYAAKYAELGPTEEDVRDAAIKAARKREEDERRAKRRGRR